MPPGGTVVAVTRRQEWDECKYCGAKAEDGVVISTRAVCPACAERRRAEAMLQIHQHAGPFYEKWLRGQRAAMERLAEELGARDTGCIGGPTSDQRTFDDLAS